jgi:hypothetical protein
MLGSVKTITNRLYSDYFMPSRIADLRDLYVSLLDAGYEFHSVISFWDNLSNGLNAEGKYFINRHDVDTDLVTTAAIFELELSLGVRSSYYFRLGTLDIDLMKSIEGAGGEASYHFEEIATLAKKYNWSADLINYSECAEFFESNYSKIKNVSGLPMRSVCSHGDFVNRKLGVVNQDLLTDDLRIKLGIEVEAYDHEFMAYVDQRFSDTLHPKYFLPSHPLSAVESSERIIYLLTHPRHWRSNVWENTKDNFVRILEGLRYRP